MAIMSPAIAGGPRALSRIIISGKVISRVAVTVDLGRRTVMSCDKCRCDEGYVLPELTIHWHEIPSTHEHAGYERDGQRRLIQDTSISVQNAAREKRDSLEVRLEKLLELRRYAPAAHRIIWHDLE